MGGAGTKCYNKKYPSEPAHNHVDLHCPNGLRFNAKNAQFGILSSESMDNQICRRSASLEDIEEYGYSDCTMMMGETWNKTFEIFKKNCHHQKGCTLPLDQIAFINDPKSSVCKKDATFYIQAPCEIMPWKVKGRKIWGFIITCVGVFMYFFA